MSEKKKPDAAAATAPRSESITVKAPNFKTAVFTIVGSEIYVQNRFAAKAGIMATQAAGSVAKSKKVRDAKDFDKLYREAMHVSREGWHGIPASCFRNAMISACRTVGYKMTHAKLACFVIADGYSAEDATPLVKITKGVPKRRDDYARNDNGSVDIRSRPMWEPGWEAIVRIRFDADMLSLRDVANLLMRVGMQVGIGEGRPDSKNSAGMGWGMFEVQSEAEANAKRGAA